MNSKKWLKIVLTSSIIIIGFVGIINYIVDPLWTFSHSNFLNAKQKGFNERQQKTNYIYFNKNLTYDSILIGSSRSAGINRNDFIGMNLFNYSSSALNPNEYRDYINFAKKTKGKDLKNIIIGIDFFGTNGIKNGEFNSPLTYIQNTTSFAYKYKMIFSKSAFNQTTRNIRISISGRDQYYDRDDVKHFKIIAEPKRKIRYEKHLKSHLHELTGKNYKYDEKYIGYLKTLKEENPNTNFIIFSSPITANLLVSIVKNIDRIEEYERWLKETISVFAEVHHFMNINSVTKKLQNYLDDDHYYPHIGKLVANKLSNTPNQDIPDDFGIILTKDNIDSYIQDFKKQIQNYNFSQ